ncbi:MAG: DUF2490 domain-containing protein [Balneolaceae bacterium]
MDTFKKVVLLVMLIMPAYGFAQNSDIIWRPIIGYSWDQTDRLSYNIKLEIFNSVRDFDNSSAIQYIEPQFSISYSLSPQAKLGGGFYSRWADPLEPGYAYEQRLLQQISFKTRAGDASISQRVRLEQRFRDSDYLNRLRYLIGLEYPLQKNSYLIASNEALLAFNTDVFSGEYRVDLGVGWNNRPRFELTLGYRTKNLFTDSDLRHVFLLTTSLGFSR